MAALLPLQDHTIVVTGGSGLLGAQLVRELRERGATVIAADINPATDDPHARPLDITSEASVKAFVAEAVAEFGPLHGWVNNAYPRTADWGARFEDIPLESWRQNIDTHLGGYYLCCQHALEQMKRQGFGSLVNMSSIYGLVGPDFTVYEGTTMTMPAAYAAIKGGLINLTRYLAAYYGPSGLRVNCVAPGGIWDHQPASFVERYEAKVPMRRMGLPADVAPVVAFLLSSDAGYITGHILPVDGGWTAI